MIVRSVPINSIAPSWLPRAQSAASTIFLSLFIIEIFLLGLYALLYGHNIAHLVSTFAFKTFVLTFFMYLMSNAPAILPSIINSFKIAGQTTGATGTTNLMDMYHQADSAAELFFCAAMASHIDDQESALEYGFFGGAPPGNGDYVHTFQGAIGHITFEFIVQGLGMLVIAGTGIMFLSLALITAESYISMFAGVFFMGFALTRYTLPFTQGYLAYTLNVGVKLLSYWVLIAVETNVLLPVLNRAGVGLINAASIQFGAQPTQSQELYLIYAGVDVAQILAMGALTWFIPNAMGRFVTKRNSSPAINVITTMAKSIKSTLAGGGTSIPAPGQISSPSSAYTVPPKGPTSSFVPFASAVVAPSAIRANPFPLQTQPLITPPSASSAAASPVVAAALGTSDNAATISPDAEEQAVQVSVSDGNDPFAAEPTIVPIVVTLNSRKPSGAEPTKINPAEDDLMRQNTVADVFEPTPSTDSAMPNTIVRQNAGENKPFLTAPANPISSPRNVSAASGTSEADLEKRPLRKAATNKTATLALFSPEQITLLPPEEFVLLLEATQWNTLSAEQIQAIEHDDRLRTIAEEIIPQRPHAPETS